MPLHVHASKAGATVRVTVVRSPHVYSVKRRRTSIGRRRIGTTRSVTTDDDGNATVRIPHPLDDLGSTYGITVESGGATADTRVVVPTANAAIHVTVERARAEFGFSVSVCGRRAAAQRQTVGGRARRGRFIARQRDAAADLTLDAQGRARGSFSTPELGHESAVRIGRRTAAAQPMQRKCRSIRRLRRLNGDGDDPNVRIALDESVYRTGETVAVTAQASGAQGEALLTFESALGIQYSVVRVSEGRATAHFRAVDAAGELQVGAVMVHDGALEWSTVADHVAR